MPVHDFSNSFGFVTGSQVRLVHCFVSSLLSLHWLTIRPTRPRHFYDLSVTPTTPSYLAPGCRKLTTRPSRTRCAPSDCITMPSSSLAHGRWSFNVRPSPAFMENFPSPCWQSVQICWSCMSGIHNLMNSLYLWCRMHLEEHIWNVLCHSLWCCILFVLCYLQVKQWTSHSWSFNSEVF